MNCLHGLTISFAPPLQSAMKQSRRVAPLSLAIVQADQRRKFTMNVSSSSASKTDETADDREQKEKSEIYSHDMTQAMGAVLTYRHELGMNYNFVCPDLIVGSCLQTPSDVDTLRRIGVRTICCLQQDSDLEYFEVDISTIQKYTMEFDDIEHLRAEIRDFDAFDLRMRLPAVVSMLHKAINRNGGITYIHCTAGLGRAPAVALAYMFWIKGYSLNEGLKQILSNRPCFPKIDAIKTATADILTGISKGRVTLTWEGDEFSTVGVSGLDIGWGQRIPLQYNKEQGTWILERDLPDGVYEYKYIVDGEWICNENELLTSPNNDGHVNNYVEISSNLANARDKEIRKRLTGEDVDLTKEEREMISEILEQYHD